MAKVLVLYYSSYGHVAQMAEAVANGAAAAGGAVSIKRMPEIAPPEVVSRAGFKVEQGHPEATPEELADFDAIIVGTPTNYGNISSQVSTFWGRTTGLWKEGKLIGKIGAAFSATSSQHGGNEASILSMHKVFLHHGMVVVGLPYSFKAQEKTDQVIGGSPYGATTIAGDDMRREPEQADLEGARYQGRHVAQIAARLFA